MTTTSNPEPILLIGGTGKTGRRVAERLTAHDVAVRVGSRSGQPRFDWQDRSTWRAALSGAAAVYVTYPPDISFPGSEDDIRALVTAAAASGVERLVLLSGRGEEIAQRCEQIVLGSPLTATCVVASLFSQDFSEYFLLDAVRSGEVALPAGEVAEPFVDAQDIADVVAAALTEEGHGGRIYEVTGPRLLTFPEAVTEISSAIGREVSYRPIPAEEYAAGMIARGFPVELTRFYEALFRTIFDGRNAHTADGVQQALGRPARDFADYVRITAATGVWDEHADE